MPTINQLIKQGRQKAVTKSKAPALSFNFNTLKKEVLPVNHHKKEVYVQL